MKHFGRIFYFILKYIYILFVAIFFISCNENLELKQELNAPSMISQEEKLIAYPKKQKNRSKSIEQEWDGWEKVKLASGDSVYVPWNNRYISTTIPVDVRQDVKANHGWDLIAHTVNGYGERGMNYLIFHNKYTGIMKVFYYLESSQAALQNTAIWKLHFEVPQSCLAFSQTYANLSTNKDIEDIYLGNITNDDSKGYTLGWNCFQTELAYDPNLIEGTLQIIPSSMTTSNIDLEGDIEMNTEGLIISATSSNIMNGAVKSSANFVGKKAESWVQKAINGNAFKNINSLIVKGAGSLVTSGVSSLLGSFIGGFNKEQQTTQSVQLKTNGTVTLGGNIKTLQTGNITPLTFSISPDDIGKLGVWSLGEMPILKLDPYAVHERQSPECPYIQYYRGANISASAKNYNINPDLLKDIKSYDVKIELFEKPDVVQYNFLKQDWRASYGPTTFPANNKLLYDKIYEPRLNFLIPVEMRDENGNEVENYEEYAPIEVYIPKTLKGEMGANPYFTFHSYYIVVVSMKMQVEQNGEPNTIVSSHTFITNMVEWEYDKCGDYYYSLYPFTSLCLDKSFI